VEVQLKVLLSSAAGSSQLHVPAALKQENSLF